MAELEYIPLQESTKKPKAKFKHGGLAWEEVKFEKDIGLLLKNMKPVVVLDFDTETSADIIIKIVQGLDIKCRLMKTRRGVHLWLRSDTPLSNQTKIPCALTLTYDVRSWGINGFVKVREEGVDREWLRKDPIEDLDPIPKWLAACDTKANFKGLKSGDSRNTRLFSYIITLQNKGFTKDEIIETIELINSYVLDEPMSESELSNILRDESFDTGAGFVAADQVIIRSNYVSLNDKGEEVLRHNVFGDSYLKDFPSVTVGSELYTYRDGFYCPSTLFLEKLIVDLYPPATERLRKEVVSYVKVKSRPLGRIEEDKNSINVMNGRLRLIDGELEDFSPDYYDFQRLPVVYDPDASSEILIQTIQKVFCYDQEVIDLFYEVVGYSLMRSSKFRKMLILVGEGRNGKSSVLNLMKRFLGYENVSTLSIQELGDKFLTAELADKLANIGDDVDSLVITKTGVLKKLASGESMTIQRKNEQPFQFRNYAKLWFSANELPRIADKSEGIYSRLLILPFNAVFNPKDEDFDPEIESKLTSDESLSTLLNLAIEGLQRLRARGRFNEPVSVQDALVVFKTENSSVLSWIADENIVREDIIEQSVQQLYGLYKSWGTGSGVTKKVSKITFGKEIRRHFNVETKTLRKRGEEPKTHFVDERTGYGIKKTKLR